jgi:Uma2 family endonuclease
VGKQKHSATQVLLAAWLLSQAQRHGKKPLVEQRIQFSSRRFRIPDVCLIDRDDHDEVPQKPPALWVEILSPDDRWSRLHRKLTEVLNFGVPTIWIIDPYEKQAWIGTPQTGIVGAEDNVLRCENLNIQVTLEEIVPAE